MEADASFQSETVMMIEGNHVDGVSSSGYARKFAYPLYVWSTISITNNGNDMTIGATMDRGKSAQNVGSSAFPNGAQSFAPNDTYNGDSFNTRQNGSAQYISLASSNTSQSWGSTGQDLTLSGIQAGPPSYPNFPAVETIQQLYSRHVLAVNATVVQDSNPSPTTNTYTAGQAPFLGSEDVDGIHGYAPPPQVNNMVGRHPRVQKRGSMYRRAASFGVFH